MMDAINFERGGIIDLWLSNTTKQLYEKCGMKS